MDRNDFCQSSFFRNEAYEPAQTTCRSCAARCSVLDRSHPGKHWEDSIPTRRRTDVLRHRQSALIRRLDGPPHPKSARIRPLRCPATSQASAHPPPGCPATSQVGAHPPLGCPFTSQVGAYPPLGCPANIPSRRVSVLGMSTSPTRHLPRRRTPHRPYRADRTPSVRSGSYTLHSGAWFLTDSVS